MGALVETRNLYPGSYGHQLLGHLPQKAGRYATVRLPAVMEQLADLPLAAGINFTRGRDILLQTHYGFVVLWIFQERFQRHAGRIGFGRRELRAQRGCRMGARDG